MLDHNLTRCYAMMRPTIICFFIIPKYQLSCPASKKVICLHSGLFFSLPLGKKYFDTLTKTVYSKHFGLILPAIFLFKIATT